MRSLRFPPSVTDVFHSPVDVAAPTNPDVCLGGVQEATFPNVVEISRSIHNQHAIVIRSVAEGRLADTTKALVLSLSHLRLHTPAENIRKLRC